MKRNDDVSMTAKKKPCLPRDLWLAERAAEADRKNKYRQAMWLYHKAAAWATKKGEKNAARIFDSKAHNLSDFIRELET
jgi:hypothetical protein